ncbi:MAG: MFS transporter [Gorillibacterium sp.]|nr:MFS transporter [Gorillibacterium sp.]
MQLLKYDAIVKQKGPVIAKMKLTTRIYLDAALQNIKSVAFFTFLPVLIVRLGASNFEVALSNMLPSLFSALSLAFLTRQLPVTRKTYLVSGYVRQFAFLSMALAVLLPRPIPYILAFWAINAISVMITSAQQPAIFRRWVEPSRFPQIFSNNKLIGIAILVVGSLVIGNTLDFFDRFFPYNYVVSMLVGCLSTFMGMNLIARLAPNEKHVVKLRPVLPFKECDRRMWWMSLNNIGIAMVGPLFTIYHIKALGLTNAQIGYFVVASGLLSAAFLPTARKWMEKSGALKVYSFAVLGMALAVIPYGWITKFWLLIIVQAWIGVCSSVFDISQQSVMMEQANLHKKEKEMDYFSDFQLLMNGGNAIGALIAGVLVSFLPIWACFVFVALFRFAFLWLPGFRPAEAGASNPFTRFTRSKPQPHPVTNGK